jgi:hypothetical protein
MLKDITIQNRAGVHGRIGAGSPIRESEFIPSNAGFALYST